MKYKCAICGKELKIGDSGIIIETPDGHKKFIHPECTDIRNFTISSEEDFDIEGIEECEEDREIASIVNDNEFIDWIKLNRPEIYKDMCDYLCLGPDESIYDVDGNVIDRYISRYPKLRDDYYYDINSYMYESVKIDN